MQPTTSSSQPKILDTDGKPLEPSAIATRPAVLNIDAGRLDLLDPDVSDERALKALEQRALFREAVVKLALRQTHPSQYVIHKSGDGDTSKESVYPEGAAADAMFGFLGMTWAVAIPFTNGNGEPDWRRGDVKWTSEVRADGDDRYYWVKSALWSHDKLIALAEGKRVIGKGFIKDAPNAELSAFENLKSRACREVLGLKGKDRAWYKLQGLDLSASHLAEHQDRKSASSSDPDEAVVKFGKAAGTKVKDLSDDDLAYYTKRQKADVADPAKAKYHPERMLKALEAEAERRAAKPAKNAEDSEELDKTIAAIREEAAALGVSGDKLKKLEDGLKDITLPQAQKWLEQYRQKRAAKAEPGSAG
jgi:hypothetical protein